MSALSPGNDNAPGQLFAAKALSRAVPVLRLPPAGRDRQQTTEGRFPNNVIDAGREAISFSVQNGTPRRTSLFAIGQRPSGWHAAHLARHSRLRSARLRKAFVLRRPFSASALLPFWIPLLLSLPPAQVTPENP